MKRLLLSGIAALFLATGAVHAAELPEAMLGGWCGAGAYDNDGIGRWRRAVNNDAEECANKGGMQVRKDGWDYSRFGPLGFCRLVAIEFLRYRSEDHINTTVLDLDGNVIGQEAIAMPPGDVYLVRAICKHDNESWNENFEVQATDDWLVTWDLAAKG